jgi:hypothetical protein
MDGPGFFDRVGRYLGFHLVHLGFGDEAGGIAHVLLDGVLESLEMPVDAGKGA